MFHPFFFHHGLDSCHCHDNLADTMQLAAAFKVEQELQERWTEEREREFQDKAKRVPLHYKTDQVE